MIKYFRFFSKCVGKNDIKMDIFVELAEKALYNWFRLAYESGVKPIIQFANRLLRYAHGIINHCIFPIHTSRIEGINNRIKIIEQKAYGFHDIEYFCLISRW